MAKKFSLQALIVEYKFFHVSIKKRFLKIQMIINMASSKQGLLEWQQIGQRIFHTKGSSIKIMKVLQSL
jgi:hypothetical protein